MRLIDADKLKQHFAWWHEGGEEADRQAEIFEQIIDVQPTVSIEQLKWERDTAIQQLRELGYDLGQNPKKGKWVNNIHDLPLCNQCGYRPQYDRALDDYYYSNYCPNCGARMEAGDAGNL